MYIHTNTILLVYLLLHIYLQREIIKVVICKVEYSALIVKVGTYSECEKFEKRLDNFMDSVLNPDTSDVEKFIDETGR